MSEHMNDQEVELFKEKLAELVGQGSEEDVRSYINDQFSRLPETMQADIVFGSLFSAVQEEVREQAALSRIKEEGLVAAEELEAAKKKFTENT